MTVKIVKFAIESKVSSKTTVLNFASLQINTAMNNFNTSANAFLTNNPISEVSSMFKQSHN